MVTKKEIDKWLKSIEELRKNIQVGGGAMISGSYSKENQELFEATTACKDLLTMYYSYEGLSPMHLKRFQTLVKDMHLKAVNYIHAKAHNKNYPYSLEGDPRHGINRAAGDKYVRLKAADDIARLALLDLMPDLEKKIEEGQNMAPVKLSPEFKKLEEKLGEPDEDLAVIKQNLKDINKKEKNKMEILGLHYEAVNVKKDYKEQLKNSFWGKPVTIGELGKHLREIENLHRLELLKYNNTKEFLKSYKENRSKIFHVVKIYNKAMEWKDGTPKQRLIYDRLRLQLGMTKEMFNDLENKVSMLEMIGRHMDYRMETCTNPEVAKMSINDLKKFSTMSSDELKSHLKTLKDNKDNPQMPDEYKPSDNMIKLFSNAIRHKKLEHYGIKQEISPKERAEYSNINRTVGDKLKRTFKFVNFQARIGRKNAGADAIAGDFDMPVMLKGKLGKVSLKYTSKNKLFSAGAHAGALGSKVVGSVGFGFSLKNPASMNIKATGSAELYGLRGVAKAKIGTANCNLIGKASGHVGHAMLEGTIALGHIYNTKGEEDDLITDGVGISLKGGATAAVVNGKLSGGFSVFGVRIGIDAVGKAGAVGAEGEFTFMPKNGVRLGVGGALGFGGSFYLTVNWRGLVEKFQNWKKRSKISKQTLELKKAEKAKKKEKQRRLANEKKSIDKAKKAIKEDAPDTRIKRSNTIKAKKPEKKAGNEAGNNINNNANHNANNHVNHNNQIKRTNSLGK